LLVELEKQFHRADYPVYLQKLSLQYDLWVVSTSFSEVVEDEVELLHLQEVFFWHFGVPCEHLVEVAVRHFSHSIGWSVPPFAVIHFFEGTKEHVGH